MKMILFMDGDNIGNQIELMLLDGLLQQASEFSERITKAMLSLKHNLEVIPETQIHVFGGDDIIAEISMEKVSISVLNRLRSEFQVASGTSISAGLGLTVELALENLRRAKLSGKNCLIGDVPSVID